MRNMMTVQRAKDEITKMAYYIDLVENYETPTLEKKMLVEYAYTNSAAKTAKNLNDSGYTIEGKPIVVEDVFKAINSKASDDLHRMLKSWYLKKTKHIRHKS
ncbi:hypothetical protein [Bacillus sp. B-jedd]|uniref:hypothetical protein n=1 Tax=Bacillus sp. B-jedd TaxID=1476857 RepID=UPI00051572B9|nr:hypothetical protein [Bacillus sp. B-jedd]CEG26025.1 hypothetical protein BN1002_00863 [Bacillus sp. B-jedd]